MATRMWLVISLLAFLVLVGLTGIPGELQAAPGGTAPVELEGYVRAIQGDTLDARMSNRRVGIGIIGIQTPQGNTACGKEATAFAQALVNDGATVEEEAGAPAAVVSTDVQRPHARRAVGRRRDGDGRIRAGERPGANRDRLAGAGGCGQERPRRGCLWQGGGAP